MKELAVSCYPGCGRYTYYQTSRHPQCPKCGTQEAMYMVKTHYTEFIRMSCDKHDEFLSREIPKANPSLVTRLTEPHRRYNSQEIIAEINSVIMNPDIENRILSDTVKWMHGIIWELAHEKRKSNRDKVPVCGVCRDRQPLEKSMEETVGMEQTEAACSEAATVSMSRTTTPEKG